MKIWHQVVESGDMNLLDDILDKDCIFYSPVVFSPQAGKEITKKYLSAAAIVFADESFKYTKEIESAKLACLEFEVVLNEIKIIAQSQSGSYLREKILSFLFFSE